MLNPYWSSTEGLNNYLAGQIPGTMTPGVESRGGQARNVLVRNRGADNTDAVYLPLQGTVSPVVPNDPVFSTNARQGYQWQQNPAEMPWQKQYELRMKEMEDARQSMAERYRAMLEQLMAQAGYYRKADGSWAALGVTPQQAEQNRIAMMGHQATMQANQFAREANQASDRNAMRQSGWSPNLNMRGTPWTPTPLRQTTAPMMQSRSQFGWW